MAATDNQQLFPDHPAAQLNCASPANALSLLCRLLPGARVFGSRLPGLCCLSGGPLPSQWCCPAIPACCCTAALPLGRPVISLLYCSLSLVGAGGSPLPAAALQLLLALLLLALLLLLLLLLLPWGTLCQQVPCQPAAQALGRRGLPALAAALVAACILVAAVAPAGTSAAVALTTAAALTATAARVPLTSLLSWRILRSCRLLTRRSGRLGGLLLLLGQGGCHGCIQGRCHHAPLLGGLAAGRGRGRKETVSKL